MKEAPGTPVLVYKNRLFEMTEGYLTGGKYPGGPEQAPEFFWKKEGNLIPLFSGFERRTIARTIGPEEILTEEQVKKMLSFLNLKETGREDSGGQYVYISSGKMFRLDSSGELLAEEHPAAAPVTWPLAHDVRPGRMSLGANGCTDCHHRSSPFFFGLVEAQGPLLTDRKAAGLRHEFMGKDLAFEKLFGFSFYLRPVLKVVLFISLVLIGAILLIFFLQGLGRFSGITNKRGG
jgi:hypothetical protein